MLGEGRFWYPHYRGSWGVHPPARSPCIWDTVSTHALPPKDASCPYPTNSTSIMTVFSVLPTHSSRRWQKAPTVKLRTSDGYEVHYSPSLIATANSLLFSPWFSRALTVQRMGTCLSRHCTATPHDHHDQLLFSRTGRSVKFISRLKENSPSNIRQSSLRSPPSGR